MRAITRQRAAEPEDVLTGLVALLEELEPEVERQPEGRGRRRETRQTGTVVVVVVVVVVELLVVEVVDVELGDGDATAAVDAIPTMARAAKSATAPRDLFEHPLGPRHPLRTLKPDQPC